MQLVVFSLQIKKMTTFNKYLLFLSLLILLPLSNAATRKTCKPVLFQFFIKIHPNCTIERLLRSDPVPPSFDKVTQVQSSDVLLHTRTQLSGRLYRPKNIPNGVRVPILIYFHGGGFVAGSPFDSYAQSQLLRISSFGKFIILSVDYVKAPEHKIPIPYRNGDKAVKWLSIQASGKGTDDSVKWLKDVVDFNRVFLGGQSSGANIAYNVAMRFQQRIKKRPNLHFGGLLLLDPYILSVETLPSLLHVPEGFRNNITRLWRFVCPKSSGPDDTRVNPALEPNLRALRPGKVLICVAERDPMIDAGRKFFEILSKNVEKTEFYETMGKGHSFDTVFPNITETTTLYEKIASFIREK